MVNRVLHQVAAARASRVTVVPWSKWLCPGGNFLVHRDGVVLRPDGVHLDQRTSAPLLWDWLRPQLVALRRPRRRSPCHRPVTGTRPGSRTLGYQPALDGIRAVAVLGVLVFHDGIERVVGGFLGVDLFFVLRGFLITTLLLREWHRTGGIALGASGPAASAGCFPPCCSCCWR